MESILKNLIAKMDEYFPMWNKNPPNGAIPVIQQAIVLVLVLALAGVALPAHAQKTLTPSFTAKIIHVDDGDTVVALNEQNQKVKIRLANIDAPETSHGRCRPGQPWSEQSKQFLSDLVKGKFVQLTCSTLDRYDRSVCDIHLGRTTANRLLVESGLAWANRAHYSYLRDPLVTKVETYAVLAKRGLWSEPQATPPWEWRKVQWNSVPGCGK
jgi:endonuclease YncB( thermonuclease family)